MLSSNDPISQYMTRSPLTIESCLTLGDARARMSDAQVRHLPVVRQGRIVGIISATDLIRLELVDGLDWDTMPLEAGMTSDPVVRDSDAPVDEVLEAMEENHLNAVPITDGASVVGMFTSVDATRLLRKAMV